MHQLIGDQAAVSDSAVLPSKTKVLWWIAIPFLILLAGETIWGSSALLTAPPMWANFAMIAGGIVCAYFLKKAVDEIHRQRNEVWQTTLWGRFSLVVFLPALLMPYALRLGIEIASFSFFPAATSSQELLIVSASGGKTWGTWLDVQFPDATGRDPRVRVTEQLHQQYWHISTLKKDCIVMQTQKGRWGVIRVLRPTYWNAPADVDRVRKNCLNPDKTSKPQAILN